MGTLINFHSGRGHPSLSRNMMQCFCFWKERFMINYDLLRELGGGYLLIETVDVPF